MNNIFPLIVIPVGYILGMIPTAFVLGWAFRKQTRQYNAGEVLVPIGTIFWPIGLPVGIVATILWPFIRLVYNLIYGAYELGKSQSDLQVGARTKKMFGRIGR